MTSSILYFFLLVLKIPLNFSLDIIYKQSRFFKILAKKCFKLAPNKRDDTFMFDLSLVLLLAEIEYIAEK